MERFEPLPKSCGEIKESEFWVQKHTREKREKKEQRSRKRSQKTEKLFAFFSRISLGEDVLFRVPNTVVVVAFPPERVNEREIKEDRSTFFLTHFWRQIKLKISLVFARFAFVSLKRVLVRLKM